MIRMGKEDILTLSVPERIQLIEDLWDSLANDPESVVLSPEQVRELDDRLSNFKNSPESGSSWAEVRERIRSRR